MSKRRPLLRSMLWLALGMASLFGATLGGDAIAQPPVNFDTQVDIAPDQEPITALPPPPDADPLKLALGERLFGDTQLSADGNMACLTCHDVNHNGTGTHESL